LEDAQERLEEASRWPSAWACWPVDDAHPGVPTTPACAAAVAGAGRAQAPHAGPAGRAGLWSAGQLGRPRNQQAHRPAEWSGPRHVRASPRAACAGVGQQGGSVGPHAGWGSWEPRPGMRGAGPRGGGGGAGGPPDAPARAGGRGRAARGARRGRAGPRGCAGERGCRALGRSRPSRQGCGAGPAEFEWAAGRPREGKRARGGLGRGVGPWWAEEGFFSFCFSSFSISSLFYFPTIKFIYNK
jgi:hypothetical protein